MIDHIIARDIACVYINEDPLAIGRWTEQQLKFKDNATNMLHLITV